MQVTHIRRKILGLVVGFLLVNTVVYAKYEFNSFTGKLDIVGEMKIGGAIANGTEDSVLFIGAGGILAQDNTNFSYVDSTNLLTVNHANTYHNFQNTAGSVDAFVPLEKNDGSAYAQGTAITYRAFPAYLKDATYVIGEAWAFDETVTITNVAGSDVEITFSTSGGDTTGILLYRSYDGGSTWETDSVYVPDASSPYTDANGEWAVNVNTTSYNQLVRLAHDDGTTKWGYYSPYNPVNFGVDGLLMGSGTLRASAFNISDTVILGASSTANEFVMKFVGGLTAGVITSNSANTINLVANDTLLEGARSTGTTGGAVQVNSVGNGNISFLNAHVGEADALENWKMQLSNGNIFQNTREGATFIGYDTTSTTTAKFVVNGNVGITNTGASSKLHILTGSLGATLPATSSGIILENNTAAAAGAQQVSPTLTFSGRGWTTTATAASYEDLFQIYNLPVQGSTGTTGSLTISHTSGRSGTVTTPLTLSSAGGLGIGSLTVTSTIHSAGQGYYTSNIAGLSTVIGAPSATGSPTLSANNSATGLFVGPLFTEAGSGTHPLITSAYIAVPTITGGVATTTVGCGLYVAGAPSIGVSNYALWVNDGITRLDGNLQIGDGTATTDYSVTFDGESNDGVYTWMEDEDYFKFDDDIHYGDGTNFANFSDTLGQITWSGTFLKKLTIRPTLVPTTTLVGGTPTQVERGLNEGYSLPIWSTPANQYEQLSFRMRIPVRWDGTTNPQVGICTTISAAEDVGDKFKFQLDWQTTGEGEEMGTTVSSVVSEQTVLTGRAAAYDTYFIFFDLDADDINNHIIAGHMLQARLRRIAASSNEVSNEIIVWDWATMWAVDKVYGAWSVESNDA